MFAIGKKEYYWLKSVNRQVPLCTWNLLHVYLKIFEGFFKLYLRNLGGYILTGADLILKILVDIFLSSVSYLRQTFLMSDKQAFLYLQIQSQFHFT